MLGMAEAGLRVVAIWQCFKSVPSVVEANEGRTLAEGLKYWTLVMALSRGFGSMNNPGN